MSTEQQPDEFKYWAFISYSHADNKWADWLHKGIETYSVPKHLVGKPSREGVVPKRPFPVFRDRDELPGSANLGDNLTKALKLSRYLVVVCSPNSAKSQWVDQEVRIFKSMGREDRVLCLIVDGEPNATAKPQLNMPECFPESVRFWVDSDRRITEIPTEPIAADARKGKDGRRNALLKVLSGILGVSFDDLKQRDAERENRKQRRIMAGMLALLVAFGFMGFRILEQKNEAVAARNEAERSAELAKEAERRARDAATLARQKEQEAVAAAEEERKAKEKQAELTKTEAEAKVAALRAQEEATKERDRATAAQKTALDEAAKARVAEAKAVEQQKLADAARADAEEKRKETAHALAGSDFSEATRLIEEGSDEKGLASLTRALRYDRENSAVITRVLAIMSQNNWSLPKFNPMQHKGPVLAAGFSPDGQRVFTLAGDTAQVWTLAGKPLGGPLKHGAAVTSAAFSPDGKWLATGSRDNKARIWEYETGNVVQEVKHTDFLRWVRFDPTRPRVVSAGQDKLARIWEAASGKVVTEITHAGVVEFAEFSADGKFLVTGTADTGQVWDSETGKAIGGPLKHDGGIASAAISPNGKWVVTGAGDKVAKVWEIATGKQIGDPLKHADWVNNVNFSGDSKYVITASSDKTARMWDAATGKQLGATFKHEGKVWWAGFSPNGKWAMTVSEDGSARIYDTATGVPAVAALKHAAGISAGAFSPDGKYVVTASADTTARVWEISVGRPFSIPLRHDGYVNAAAFSPDANWIATVTEDRSVKVWESGTGKQLFTETPFRHDGRVSSVSFSPDGKYLLTGSDDRTARVWDLTQGKPLLEAPLKCDGRVNSSVFSPDGSFVLTASETDNSARLWQMPSGKLWKQPMVHTRAVRLAAFSPDGKYVVTASLDKTARVWETETAKQVGASMTNAGEVYWASFGGPSTNLMVAAACEDKTARVWKAPSGTPVTPPLIHDAKVDIVQLSPNGRLLLTSAGSTLRIWDTTTGRLASEALKLDHSINAAVFSPDGLSVATASEKTAQLWETSTLKPITKPFRHDDTVRNVAFSRDGRFLATASADKSARVWLVSLPGVAPDWLLQLAESVGGFRLGNAGAAQLIGDPWAQYAASRKAMGDSAGGNDRFAEWGEWFTKERLQRTIAPFSTVPVTDYVKQRVEEGTLAALNEVLEFQPNHAMALAKLSRVVKDAEQVEFYSRLAANYEPNNPDVLWLRGQALQSQNKFPEAFVVMEKAAGLDPRVVTVFGPEGREFNIHNRENAVSKGWLPKGWDDLNLASTSSVTYEKLTDGPTSDATAIRITTTNTVRGQTILRGPRFLGKHNTKYVVEGLVRSAAKTDMTVTIRQTLDPFTGLQVQQQRSTPEWTRFTISYNPSLDVAAEVIFSQPTGTSIDIAGVVVRAQ
jgi:WD40 repeat protein